MQHHTTQKRLHHFEWDIPLIAMTFLIICIGTLTLISADSFSWDILNKQIIRISIAWACFLAMSYIRPLTLFRITPFVYGLGMLLLLAVIFFGSSSNGAKRWLNLGLFTLQPSELIKCIMPLMSAYILHIRPNPPDLKTLTMVLLAVLLPTCIIAKQPDLGTAILVAISGLLPIFLAGLSRIILLGGTTLILGACPIIWHVLHDYQKQRILTFLHPEQDPLGHGYHVIQSKIAIGSGGIFGKGWMHGTQAHLHFLPEHTTDFIFSVFSEQYGWIGCVFIICLMFTISMRITTLAKKMSLSFSRLSAATIGLQYMIMACINIAMVSGLLPVVGVPLVFFSFGGTSMVTTMLSFGLVMGMYRHRRVMFD